MSIECVYGSFFIVGNFIQITAKCTIGKCSIYLIGMSEPEHRTYWIRFEINAATFTICFLGIRKINIRRTMKDYASKFKDIKSNIENLHVHMETALKLNNFNEKHSEKYESVCNACNMQNTEYLIEVSSITLKLLICETCTAFEMKFHFNVQQSSVDVLNLKAKMHLLNICDLPLCWEIFLWIVYVLHVIFGCI